MRPRVPEPEDGPTGEAALLGPRSQLDPGSVGGEVLDLVPAHPDRRVWREQALAHGRREPPQHEEHGQADKGARQEPLPLSRAPGDADGREQQRHAEGGS